MTGTLSRRDLFGRWTGEKPRQQRPPWARREAEFTDACTRCGACIEACPTGVLVEGASRYPVIHFSTAACTLCAACAEACPVDCFDSVHGVPWTIKARIGGSCIETRGVACRVCEDGCEQQAIRFRPTRGGGYTASISEDLCNGCGSCAAVCPVKAISVEPSHSREVNS